MKNLGLLASLLALILTLQGCVVAVGAAGAMAAKVANDRRTVGTQLDDQNADSARVKMFVIAACYRRYSGSTSR